MNLNRALPSPVRLAAALLAAAALAGCGRMPHWTQLGNWDHPDAHVLGTFESYRPSESGRLATLDLQPEFKASLVVSYVWKRETSTQTGTWKREDDAVVVTFEGGAEKRDPLRFEWQDGALKNTAWNRDEFGSQGLGELRRK